MCIRDRAEGVAIEEVLLFDVAVLRKVDIGGEEGVRVLGYRCLLYTSDAADERSSVDLGGRRIIKKKQEEKNNTKKKNNYIIQDYSTTSS